MTTSRRRPSRSHDARLGKLEEALTPPPAESPQPIQQLVALLQWATAAGGHARELSTSAADLLAEHLQLVTASIASGEIVPGERFPRLLTGQWNLSAEQHARMARVNSELDRITHELAALRRAEHEGTRP